MLEWDGGETDNTSHQPTVRSAMNEWFSYSGTQLLDNILCRFLSASNADCASFSETSQPR